jgi:acetyl-CoA carboxylase biotin carboxyl carrier protein
MSELTHDDVQKILKIIDAIGDRDMRLEIGDLKLYVNRGNAPAGALSSSFSASPPAEKAPAPAAQRAATSLEPQPKFEVPAGQVAVRAPTIGTFYLASSPGAKPFVKVGDHVEPNDIVCVFEVMKLFSSLSVGVAGTVTAILIENERLVEQDQPLILITPD